MRGIIVCLFYLLLLGVGSSSEVDQKLQSWWNTVSTSYPRYNETKFLLEDMSKTFPDLVEVYNIGESVQGRDLMVIKISKDVRAERPLLRPPMKIVANMHGDETVGRAVTLMLAVDLLKEYQNGNQR